ncbi:MAG: MarR family transcriptional regulator [Nitrososphaerales archaeon]
MILEQSSFQAQVRSNNWFQRVLAKKSSIVKYIQLCLGWKLSHGDEPITRKVVGEVVTEEEITADWEMEMHQIFPHGDGWNYAAKVMNILCTLSEKEIYPTLTQLAKVIGFVSRSDLSRIITKLEERGYIRRTRTPAGKVISVNW